MAPQLSVIVNPAAKGGRIRALLPKLRQYLDRSGLAYELLVSPAPDAPACLARQVLAAGHHVVACGGDGLIGALVGPVSETGTPLGIIPLGSGNDLARALGFDLKHPFSAVSALTQGHVLNMDMGVANGHVFCTVAGTGFDAEAAAWARRVTWLSGNPLYVAAVIRTLAKFLPRRVRITVDGAVYDKEVCLVAVANTRFYGGGMQVAPNADHGDGQLEVVMVDAIGRFGFLHAFPRVYSGSHLDLPCVTAARGRHVTIEPADHGAPLPWMVDGELVGTLPLDVTVRSASLKVLVPRPQSP